MTNPAPPPAEHFAAFIRCLTLAVAGRGMWGPLSSALVAFINLRLFHIRRRVQEIFARLDAGTYAPRRSGPRRKPTARRPRPPSPVPLTFGWLEPLLPELAPHRGQLLHMLQDPQMVAAITAAPGALGRPLRSLCWMLRLKPPAILARPKPPPAPPEAAPETAEPTLPPRTPPPVRAISAPRRLVPGSTCGPPQPA